MSANIFCFPNLMIHAVFVELSGTGVNKARSVDKILSIVHREFEQTAASRYFVHLKLQLIR